MSATKTVKTEETKVSKAATKTAVIKEVKAPTKSGSGEKITVKLVRSSIRCTERQLATLRGLGLKRTGSTKELESTSAVHGMIKRVSRVVEIVK